MLPWQYTFFTVGLVLSLLAPVRTSQAQAEPPAAAGPVAEPATAPVAAAEPVQCVPKCRRGYTCAAGQCVSDCNPPCAPGEQCRNGECFAPPPPPPIEPSMQPPDPGIQRHDGFMLRLTLGFGWSSALSSASSTSDDFTFSGVSASFSFDLGGAVSENLVLHARISTLSMTNPNVSLHGDDVSEIDDASLTGIMFGPALTYYFMPANIYLTLALGMSWLTEDTNQTDARDTDVGFGSNLDLGKEWWVSDNWGLGIAARFWFTHLTDTVGGDDFTYDLLGFAVFFSATYN